MPQDTRRVLSTRDIALRYGVPLPSVVKVIDRLALADRIGRNRVIMSEYVQRVEDGLRGAGLLKPTGAEGNHA
jgi:hypothetical protein